MSSIAIYMEGGGDGKDSKAALRLGMETLSDPAERRSQGKGVEVESCLLRRAQCRFRRLSKRRSE
jgi:hypothetical protein